jgi:hypothetical protein
MPMVGSDGKIFALMFPNALDKGYYIVVGETLALLASDWRIQPLFDRQISYEVVWILECDGQRNG